MIKIEVFSHFMFDEKCEEEHLNDENVEESDIAFISIIGTQECLKHFLMETATKHYFEDHDNVLNLDFDDISTDLIYNGHRFSAMSIKQAEEAVDFIERMISKGVSKIRIHCRAGYSRSRAFGEFIYRYCLDNHVDVDYDERNNYSTFLNQNVLCKLTNAYWKKHKINQYANGEDYDEELVNPQVKYFND